MAETLRHFIGNEFVAPSDGDFITSVNPTRPQEEVARVPAGSAESVCAAVSAAHDAQGGWRRRTGADRANILNRWADAINDVAIEMAAAIVREVGKPMGEAAGEVDRAVAILRYFAGEAVRETGSVIPGLAPGSVQYSMRVPVGVAALITPWNFPIAIPLWKAAPALAVGNTVVLKPAEASSWVAAKLAETALAAGMPAGVFNVLFGSGVEIGPALIGHEGVGVLSFTGSERAGTAIAQACAARNLKFQTEMGGKNVAIVLDDANLAQAATLIAGGAMRFAGQKCTATSRVVVTPGVRDEFLKELKMAVTALPVGDPAEKATAVGPVISAASQSSLRMSLEEANADRIYSGPIPSDGFFVPPTIFTGVDPESDLAQNELFGPVLAVLDANDLSHALDLANQTRFGLSAAVFTRDLKSTFEYIDRIQVGMVRVNGDTTGVDLHAPFGGFKQSSSHSREQGAVAKDFYTDLKTVQINP
jgi:alpha-ketoglutaric semialdehyde dehydrogenase